MGGDPLLRHSRRPDALFTIPEAAAYSGLYEQQVRDMIARGELTALRRPVQIPVKDVQGRPIDARLLRVLVTTAGQEFAVHHCRIRKRKIGEYLRGASGDVWTCPEQAFGV